MLKLAMKKGMGKLPETISEMIHRRKAAEADEQAYAKASRPVTGEQRAGFAGRGGEDADFDFDEKEDFADDEEGDLFLEKDDEEKAAERKILEDQKKANVLCDEGRERIR